MAAVARPQTCNAYAPIAVFRILGCIVVLASIAPGIVGAQKVLGGSRAALRRAVCRDTPCSVEWVLPAGNADRGVRLAVVRVREGVVRCHDDAPQRGYRDWLVSVRRGRVRAERELVRGEMPCLEWSLSAWRFEGGELIFDFGGIGAPPAAGTDLRPIHVHFRPSPLAITVTYHGDQRTSSATIPSSGPIYLLTM
jgi:hypothetical protein